MALESVTYVGDLVVTNPTSADPKSAGDDHLRNLKTALRDSFAGFTGAILVTGVDGGLVNAYTLTPATALPSYSAKMLVEFAPTITNTGAATLNISGLGTKPIIGQSGAALSAGALVAGRTYLAAYDGTSFRLTTVTDAYINVLSTAVFASLIAAELPGFAGAAMVSGTDGGTVNTYTLTPSDALSSYGLRTTVLFSPAATNTGASTLNISGLGAKSILSVSGAALVAGDLTAGDTFAAVYDGTQFRLLSLTKNYADQLAFSAALPAQVGNSGKFLTTNGTSASWVGGGLTLLATLTPTVAANVDFLSTFTSSYDSYLIVVTGVVPATGSSGLSMRLAVAGAAVSTSIYGQEVPFGGAAYSSAGSTQATAAAQATAAGLGANAEIRIFNVNSTSAIKSFVCASQAHDSGVNFSNDSKAGVFQSSSVVTGARLYWTGGQNFAAQGKVRIYGISNS